MMAKIHEMLSESHRRILFPEIDDLASIKGDDIVCILPRPKPCAATKHLSEIFKFEKNLEHFGQ